MNPLDQLLPPIEPAAIGLWPPAPGWWLLAALLPVLLWSLYLLFKRMRGNKAKLPEDISQDPLRLSALAELNALTKPYDNAQAGPWLQALNGLLKRLCIQRYPDSQCHTLTSRQWLAYLDNRCPAAGLTRWMVLVEGAYRPNCILDDKAIAGLNQAVDTWIRKHV